MHFFLFLSLALCVCVCVVNLFRTANVDVRDINGKWRWRCIYFFPFCSQRTTRYSLYSALYTQFRTNGFFFSKVPICYNRIVSECHNSYNMVAVVIWFWCRTHWHKAKLEIMRAVCVFFALSQNGKYSIKLTELSLCWRWVARSFSHAPWLFELYKLEKQHPVTFKKVYNNRQKNQRT